MRDAPEADELLLRLFSYCATESRQPTEDFVTEALGWILEQSSEFRAAFLRELKLHSVAAASDWKVSTQRGFQLRHTQSSAEYVAPENLRGRFDLLLVSEEANAIVVIESKVESDLDEEQLQKYACWLDDQIGKKAFLIAITKKFQSSKIANECIRWSALQSFLANWTHSGAAVDVIIRSLAHFLKDKGMTPLTLRPLAAPLLDAIAEWHSLESEMDAVLNRFRSDDAVKAMVGPLSVPRVDKNVFSWRGVYSGDKQYYAGFAYSLIPKTPSAFVYVEFGFAGDRQELSKKLPPSLKDKFSTGLKLQHAPDSFSGKKRDSFMWDGRTVFAFAETLTEELNGHPDAIIDWFTTTTNEAVQFFGSKFKA